MRGPGPSRMPLDVARHRRINSAYRQVIEKRGRTWGAVAETARRLGLSREQVQAHVGRPRAPHVCPACSIDPIAS